jgi:HEAT repeat protein
LRWLVATALLAIGQSAFGQSIEDWLEQYEFATQRQDQESRILALKYMLDFRDPRINRVFLDALFDSPVSNQAKWCLIRVGGSAFPEGWKKIESDPARFAHYVFWVWTQCGPGGAREVVKGFDHTSEVVLRETARLFSELRYGYVKLEWLPMPDVHRGLLRALDAEDPVTRRYAVKSMVYLKKEDRDPALLKALRDTDAGVREQSLAVMHLLSGERKVGIMAAATSDLDPKVRTMALKALGLEPWNYPQTASVRVGAMISCLKDVDPQVRQVALHALLTWVNPRGVYSYQNIPLSAEKQAATESVRALLREKKVADTAYLLLSDAVASATALTYLAYVADQRVFQRLIAECESESNEVSRNSVVLLGAFGDPKALPVLRRMVERNVHRSEAESSIQQIEARNSGG